MTVGYYKLVSKKERTLVITTLLMDLPKALPYVRVEQMHRALSLPKTQQEVEEIWDNEEEYDEGEEWWKAERR